MAAGYSKSLAQRIVDRVVKNGKPIGYRADREPDASWYRPSPHKPGQHFKYEPPKPHIYNPDVECPEDYRPEPEKPKQQQGSRRFVNGTWYYLNPRDGKYYDVKGSPLR